MRNYTRSPTSENEVQACEGIYTVSFWVWKMESGTTVLTLLNVVTDAFTSILEGSLPFVLVNMKFVYKCECIIKCKMLI